jgi:large subunit ribosomal protein L21
MRKAVIEVSGTQHLVAEGDEITVNLLETDNKSVTFVPLMVADGENTVVGTPEIKGSTVTASIIDADSQGDKVLAIRYKSKKRVHKVRGHRQRLTSLRITSIK